MYFATHSHAILIDGVYDGMDVVILAAYQMLIPLLYKPVSEKVPYGFAQVESLFILIKGSILILVTLLVIYNNIVDILHGGSNLDTGLILWFEFALTVFCVAGWLLMRHLSRRLRTPMIKVEVITWKIDVFLSLGAFLGFGMELPFRHYDVLEWTIPYIDPVISCVIAALMLPEPTKAFIKAIRELVLMAPPEDKIEEIRTIVTDGLRGYPYDVDFIDAVRTGRRLWISLYVTTPSNLMNIRQLKEATDKLRALLSARYVGVYLELVPDVAPETSISTEPIASPESPAVPETTVPPEAPVVPETSLIK